MILFLFNLYSNLIHNPVHVNYFLTSCIILVWRFFGLAVSINSPIFGK
jgi:hypothetical protein